MPMNCLDVLITLGLIRVPAHTLSVLITCRGTAMPCPYSSGMKFGCAHVCASALLKHKELPLFLRQPHEFDSGLEAGDLPASIIFLIEFRINPNNSERPYM